LEFIYFSGQILGQYFKIGHTTSFHTLRAS
jgi:hypothetical protein